MKKMILTLAIAITTMSAFAGEDNVNQQVLDAFKTEFATAKNVEWTVEKDYYKATFIYNERFVFAYYSESGELLGLTRNISTPDLPLALQNSLKKNYDEYWISGLFEVVKGDDTNYYITIEDADTKIVLKSSGNTWNAYSKSRKS